MRTFLKRFTLFFLFLSFSYIFILLLVSTRFLTNKLPNAQNLGNEIFLKKLRILDTAKNIDIFFVGSSHCNNSFDPRVFSKEGYKAFNLSTYSLRPFNAYYLLKNYKDKISGKIVVLETSYNLMNEHNINEAALNIVSNTELNANVWEMVLKTKDFVAINSTVALWVERIVHPLKNEKLKISPYIGFNAARSNKSLANQIDSIDYYTPPVTHLSFEYLQKTIDIIKECHAIPVLIMTPVYKEYKNKSLNYSSVCYSIDSIANENKLTFINYDDSLNYSRLNLDINSDFFDFNHLAESGAGKLSKVVLEDLQKKEILKSNK
jgi:hypothetical protein